MLLVVDPLTPRSRFGCVARLKIGGHPTRSEPTLYSALRLPADVPAPPSGHSRASTAPADPPSAWHLDLSDRLISAHHTAHPCSTGVSPPTPSHARTTRPRSTSRSHTAKCASLTLPAAPLRLCLSSPARRQPHHPIAGQSLGAPSGDVEHPTRALVHHMRWRWREPSGEGSQLFLVCEYAGRRASFQEARGTKEDLEVCAAHGSR